MTNEKITPQKPTIACSRVPQSRKASDAEPTPTIAVPLCSSVPQCSKASTAEPRGDRQPKKPTPTIAFPLDSPPPQCKRSLHCSADPQPMKRTYADQCIRAPDPQPMKRKRSLHSDEKKCGPLSGSLLG